MSEKSLLLPCVPESVAMLARALLAFRVTVSLPAVEVVKFVSEFPVVLHHISYGLYHPQ